MTLGNILLGSQEPEQRVSLAYIDGKLPPRYPVPSTLVRTDVPGDFLGNGIFEYYPDKSIKWGIYDAPLPDGSRLID